MTDISPENWERVKALFEEALECAPAARAAFVEEHAGDPAVRDEVLRLLGEHDQAGSFLSNAMHSDFAASGLGRLTPGELLDGKFKIIQLIAEGGMGQVWLAEQTIPLKRQVVVKLIKAGLFDEGLLQRFQAERQSLAIMDHPSIAKVFDAGATQAGQPYFVMEYVPGLSITKYCDEKKLSIGDRLELFIKVCEGVQHAHQKAIIHRDLKPANILIVEIDGKPVPRIIDFGIAKATTPLAGEGEFTQIGGFVGTPGYMSPEQTDARVADVDTRSDVYSLGAILYVLLAGSLPFDPKEWKEQPLDEMLRRMREDDPPRPSTKVSTGREAVAAAAEARATDVKRLVGLLRGDLDWITMKALEKERARRYGTPTELAADIRRHLNNEPVQAGPANTGYRLRKYVRRHRVGVAVGAGVAVLLVGFGVLQAVQLRRTVRERDRANRITDFMTGMFKVSDPSEARGNSITAREILDKASKEIDSGLAKDPDLQAQMMNTMGTVYYKLGLYPQAESLLNRAIAVDLHSIGALNQITLLTKRNLADTLYQQGRYPDAEKLDREIITASSRVLGPEHVETLKAKNSLAIVLIDEGHYSDAEKLLRETIDQDRRVFGPQQTDTLIALGNLAAVLAREGRYADSEKPLREILNTYQRTLGPDHPETLRTMNNLGFIINQEGRHVEAEKMLREALDADRRVLGPDHPETLRPASNLAAVLNDEGRYAEAEKLLRELLATASRVRGPEHPETVDDIFNLANALLYQKRYEEGVTLHRQALEIRRRVDGPEHPDTLVSMGSLAAGLTMEKRYAEAETLYRQAQDIQRRLLGPDNPNTAASTYNLACTIAHEGRRDEALMLLRQAIDHGLPSDSALGMEKDTDLQSLHGDPKFDALVVYAKQHAVAGTTK